MYPVTREWQEKVRAELEAQPRGAQARLAEAVGASTGQISELLAARDHKEARYSRLVGRVNKYFGWPPPPPMVLSPDREEIQYLLDGLGNEAKDLLRALREMSPEQQRAAAQFIVQMARARGEK